MKFKGFIERACNISIVGSTMLDFCIIVFEAIIEKDEAYSILQLGSECHYGAWEFSLLSNLYRFSVDDTLDWE